MAVRKRGLGRGLDALIGGDRTSQENEKEESSGTHPAKEEREGGRTREAKSSGKEPSKGSPAGNARGKLTENQKNHSKGNEKKEPGESGAARAADARDVVQNIRIEKIHADESQPRKMFDEDSLDELTSSIKERGVLQPLIVSRDAGTDSYTIIAGERRYRAAMAAGLKTLPALVREYSQQETLEVALIENIQREDLNPIEEAQAYQRLMKDYGLKQDEISHRVGKKRATIANSLRLLHLSDEVQALVADGTLSQGHAKVLAGVSSKEKQAKLASRCVKNAWSVRQLEKAAGPGKSGDKLEKEEDSQESAEQLAYRSAGNEMQEILGTKVQIVPGKKKGRIEIEYYSMEELERLMDLIRRLR